MADDSTRVARTLKGRVGEAEWSARGELAALYRLAASARRRPGRGMLFDGA